MTRPRAARRRAVLVHGRGRVQAGEESRPGKSPGRGRVQAAEEQRTRPSASSDQPGPAARIGKASTASRSADQGLKLLVRSRIPPCEGDGPIPGRCGVERRNTVQARLRCLPRRTPPSPRRRRAFDDTRGRLQWLPRRQPLLGGAAHRCLLLSEPGGLRARRARRRSVQPTAWWLRPRPRQGLVQNQSTQR
jgi:hypothetical protein